MGQSSKNERGRLAAEVARKQLADGTWPEVMEVFGYPNPKAPRISDKEYDRLKALFEKATCPNMAAFIELLRFAEKEHGVTMSFNLSMRKRLVPGKAPQLVPENLRLFANLLFSTPDILVGTRSGIEGAAVWLKNFSEVMSNSAPESVQVLDKIFGEANELLKRPSHKTNIAKMFKSTVLGEDDASKPPDVSSH
jgi:hypothetical protein